MKTDIHNKGFEIEADMNWKWPIDGTPNMK